MNHHEQVFQSVQFNQVYAKQWGMRVWKGSKHHEHSDGISSSNQLINEARVQTVRSPHRKKSVNIESQNQLDKEQHWLFKIDF
jgi:hypothetical protein